MTPDGNPKIGFLSTIFLPIWKLGRIRRTGSAPAVVLALFSLCGLVACDRSGTDPEPQAAERAEPAQTDWPLFRGDPEMRGGTSELIAPPLRLRWTYETPGEEGKRRPPIEASPVIADGRVFVGSQDSSFYAIDLMEGSLAWSFKAEGPIIAPGAVLDDLVFFGDTYGFVYALSVTDGKEVWRFETEGKIEGGINTLVEEGSPTRVFVGSHDYFVYCLDASNGALLWKQETGNYVVATPSLVRGEGRVDLTFGGCDGLLHVLPANGEGERREIEIGAYVANTSAVRDGICYVAHNGGEVVALDIASGEKVWSQATGVEYTASPAVDAENLYVAGPDKRLVAYNRVDGTEKWAFLSRRALASSPLVSDGVVWQAGRDGRLYAVNRDDGAELWHFEIGTQIKASPAVSRGTLVVCGEDGKVYAFGK